MVSEINVAKILAKIDKLKREKTELAQKLQKEKYFNAAVWAEYGSELCSTEMAANELAIAKQIKDIAEKINILEQYLAGAFSASERALLYELVAFNDKIIKTLEEKKLKFQKSLDKFVLLNALLLQSGIK